jgi:endonuclease YncB( thermonuclease family)
MSSWAKYVPLYLAAAAIGGAYGTGVFDGLGGQPAQAAASAGERIQFSSCHVGGGYNCVVDGDTIWLKGQKVRIADIDTPETHDFRCPSEKELGDRATKRLQQLLNNGAVALQPIDRDEDRYGRKLRIVLVNGASVGDTLVGEGLARWYGSGRQPWC